MHQPTPTDATSSFSTTSYERSTVATAAITTTSTIIVTTEPRVTITVAYAAIANAASSLADAIITVTTTASTTVATPTAFVSAHPLHRRPHLLRSSMELRCLEGLALQARLFASRHTRENCPPCVVVPRKLC